MSASSQGPLAHPPELEVIACSLDDAVAAYRGGASRLEVTVRLDQAGLTPPLEMVEEIIQTVPLPIRVMLRDRPDFSAGDNAELESLKRKAIEFSALNLGAHAGGCVDGLVAGHIQNGNLDWAALEEVISVAPNLRVTVHHAIEATHDPFETLRNLHKFPSVDRALVSGGAGSLAARIERLVRMRGAIGPERSLIAGGNLAMHMLAPIREATGIRIFHLGRAVRTPEESRGRVDGEKVRIAAGLLGLK